MNPAAANPGTDPLAGLRGLHLPEGSGAWPPAPGWWLVAALVVGLGVASVLWLRHRRRSLLVHALRELDGLVLRRTGDHDLQALATDIAQLLRRVALARFGARRVAPLHGSAWQTFIEEHSATRRRTVRNQPDFARALAVAPYAPAPRFRDAIGLERTALVDAARTWIRGIA